MAAALVGGALIGVAFDQLLSTVKEAASKTKEFKGLLNQLESTLNGITPTINEIKKLDEDLDRPVLETKVYTDMLEEGKRLVDECATVHRWNLCARFRHSNKLIEYNESLGRFQFHVMLQNGKIGREILKVVVGRGVGDGNRLVGCCGVPGVLGLEPVGLQEPVRVVKEMVLMSGGEKVVVVSAPGGCGKTTLAKMVCHHPDVKGRFKDIFFVTVSKKPNINVIIQKLFEHKAFRVPEFQSNEDAINQLEGMLKQIGPNPTLLVLDDVWNGLESFIEKLAIQIPEIKILVTSRFVFSRFKSTYKLERLAHEDAMKLFRHSAFPQDGNSFMPDYDLEDKIVRKCCGFPLALEVVGGSLRGEPEEIWKSKQKQWYKGESLFSLESNKEILMCLQDSLNSLNEIHKECYLDLASFPEDKRISASVLTDMWTKLYNLKEDEDTIVLLHELSIRNLVNQVLLRKDANEISGYRNEHFVTQHDILRELAIHQCSQENIEKRRRLIIEIEGNDFPGWWIEQGQYSICARLVSISTDERFSSKWHDMQLPEVEVLVLNMQTRNYTLPQFLEKMDKLKVLIIANHGFLLSEIQSIPLLCHLSSLKRIGYERVIISSIIDFILKLRNLQKVSFIMCEISEAFRECTVRIPNMLPNLSEIVIDCCSDLVEFPAFLCEIISLKKLSVTTCHKLVTISEEFGKLENLEVLRLHACSELLQLPETIVNLKKLDLLDISDCIRISKLPEQMGDMCGLTMIHMGGCDGLSELPSSIEDLEKLKKVTCDEAIVGHFPNKLKNLEIHVHKKDVSLNWL